MFSRSSRQVALTAEGETFYAAALRAIEAAEEADFAVAPGNLLGGTLRIRSVPTFAARTAGDKWHLDQVSIRIAGVKHWLWRAVDQTGMVLDVLVQKRPDKWAAKRLLRKLLKRLGRAPRVMVTDRLPSYGVAKGKLMPGVE